MTDQELLRLRDHFLLSRDDLLGVIADSGRTPYLPGGGALETEVVNEGYSYPQLWIVDAGTDYTRFDRFHINVRTDGTGTDEVMQVIAGQAWWFACAGPAGSCIAWNSPARTTAAVGW